MSAVLHATPADLASAAAVLRRLGLRLLRELLHDGEGLPLRAWMSSREARLFAERRLYRPRTLLRQDVLIPSRLLPVVGRCAWDSPRFRVRAAAILTDHVRGRLVVSLGDVPVPRADAVLMWLLVAASPVRVPLLARIGIAHTRRRRAAERLQREARWIVGATPMPRGFWAQWITWHVNLRQRGPIPSGWWPAIEHFDRPGEPGASSIAVNYRAWYRAKE